MSKLVRFKCSTMGSQMQMAESMWRLRRMHSWYGNSTVSMERKNKWRYRQCIIKLGNKNATSRLYSQCHKNKTYPKQKQKTKKTLTKQKCNNQTISGVTKLNSYFFVSQMLSLSDRTHASLPSSVRPRYLFNFYHCLSLPLEQL